jgi:hypothetical protein
MSDGEMIGQFILWPNGAEDPSVSEAKVVTVCKIEDDDEPTLIEFGFSHGKATHYLRIDREDLMVLLGRLK